MDQVNKKLIEVEGRQASLGKSLNQIDEALQAGREIDPVALREFCARWNSHDELATRLHDLSKHWPTWTRGCVLEGVYLSIARKHGQDKSYIELYIESNQTPPPNLAVLPMQAWTVLNKWLAEGGQKTGVDLPPWVWDYLGEASRKMQNLRANAGSPSSILRDGVIAALGYSTGKGDVFKADFNDLETSVAALIYNNEGHKGLRGEARIAAVKTFFGLQDTRTARRYVSEGRKGMKPPPPWLKE